MKDEPLERVISICVEWALPDAAAAAASMRESGKLTTDEIDEIVKKLINEAKYSEAVDAGKLGASEGVIIRLISTCTAAGLYSSTKSAMDLLRDLYKIRITSAVIDLLVEKCEILTKIKAAKLGASEEAINEIVKEFINKADIDRAIEAAKLRESGKLSTDEIDDYIQICVKSGLAKRAIKASSYRESGKLTTAEIDDLINKIGFDDLPIKVMVAEIGASPDVLDHVIDRCIENGYVRLAYRAAAKRENPGLSANETDELITACVKKARRDWSSISEIKLVGASVDVLDNLTRTALADNWLDKAASFATQGVSITVRDEVVSVLIKEHMLHYAEKVLELGVSEESLHALVAYYTDRYDVESAISAAKYRDTGVLTKDEIDTLIARCISEGKVVEAVQAASLREDKSLTYTELLLLAMAIKKS